MKHASSGGTSRHSRPLPVPPFPEISFSRCAFVVVALLIAVAAVAAAPPAANRPSPEPRSTRPAGKPIPVVEVTAKRMTEEEKRHWDATHGVLAAQP